MKKWVIFLILIPLFTVTMAVGCEGIEQMYIFPKNNTPRYIIVNDEFAILHNERIYYSYSSGFFSMNTDGSDNQMLNDVFARHIHIVNDKVYFENSSYRGYVFSMGIDGTDLQQLNDDSVWEINVIDDWIYYNISRNSGNRYGDDGMGIYKMRTDGSERQLMTDDEVNNFDVVGDTIYYSTLEGYFSIDIDGNNRKIIDDSTFFSYTVSNQVYYVSEYNGKIYSSRTDGSDRRKLSNDEWITLFGGVPFGSDQAYYYIFIFKTGS